MSARAAARSESESSAATLVLERADVPGGQALVPGLEHPAHDLPTASLGQLVAELDLARRGMAGQVLLHVPGDLFLEGLARLESRAQRDERLDDLAAQLVGLADHARLGHRRVRHQ